MSRVKSIAVRCIHCGRVFYVKRPKNWQISCPTCREVTRHIRTGTPAYSTERRNRGVVPLVPTE